ncbi:MAG: class II glutamine amidotransferase [Chloroherpetonaceae bacterium]|nr:class II glutamine amidotransferase [Chloroherpetonaceae bacterium]MDW8438654.1 class II glutamine amidotransferase [Chloroherpetonaceae bacterium]
MCRMGIYRGKPITLKRFIFDPPHNFVEQARTPREMVITPINVDGYGLAWYNLDLHPEPAVMKSEKPFWHDLNAASISDKIVSGNIFMHVRAASPGLPVHQANSHPFQYKEQLFMHNGVVSDFKKGFMRSIRQMIVEPFYSHILGTTDSEHIFNLYLTIRHEQPALTMREATLELFERLNFLAKKHDSDLILNFGINDGKTTIATCYTNIDKAATLYFTHSSPFFPDAIVVASEPLDYRDPSWQKFPMNHLIEIDAQNQWRFAPIPNPFFKEGALPAAKPVTLKISTPVGE